MTISPKSSPNSETTGARSLASVASSLIGGAPSETKFVATSEPSQSLARLLPADTDKRVADALQRISGRAPAFRRRTMFPENGPIFSLTEAVSWNCDERDRAQALTAVEFSLRPATENALAAALYELRVVTRGRVNREASEDEAEALIWIERLRQFPADIVIDTLRRWPTRPDGQWWPTWHDVEKALSAATVPRKMLAEHIRSGACLGTPPKPEPAPAEDPDMWERRKAQADALRARFAEPTPESRKPMTEEQLSDWSKGFAERMRAEPMALSEGALKALRERDEIRAAMAPILKSQGEAA